MAHTFSNILIHVVFSTKERRPIIHDAFRERLWAYMGGVAKNEFGRARAIGGTQDHVHALLSLNTTTPVAKAMERWKSVSSGWLHRTAPEARSFSWQTGYGAFSVSESSAAAVIEYIRNQAEHHRGRSFREEFLQLLKKHNIDYDPEHVLD